jgi:bifunctional UDP-N-acetylglucosamine pyrophosphorylase / glucosamine-1-phosphate N-acetyltransferase
VSPTRPAAVVVLAAGEGTRMRSATPKVLHEVGGRSMVAHAVAAASGLDPEHLVVVVGHGREQVTAHLAEVAPQAKTAVQDRQDGTGHAVECGLAGLPALSGTVVVTYGDVPLLTGDTLADLVARHESDGNAVTVLTAEVGDPTGYGRILRDADGSVAGIVEQKDATAAQRAVLEVNSGIYAFDGAVLADALTRLDADNAQGELYLTDVLGIARGDGRRVGAVTTADTWQTEGVNDRVQLAAVHREMNRRTLERHMRAGVTVLDPATTWLDAAVTCEPDAVLHPDTQLSGRTYVGAGAEVGPGCLLHDTAVGAGARVLHTVAYGSEVGPEASVGPYAYLRPGTRLARNGKIGTFVETKNADIGEGTKVPHLSYVGDATIGEGSNVGAATVFVNYDGVAKHRTTIGDHARTGADNMFVAPVDVGDGAYTAAGSVITEDVPPGAMGVARGRQRNIEGWVERKRPGTRAAEAAARARDAAEPPAGDDPPGGGAPDRARGEHGQDDTEGATHQ